MAVEEVFRRLDEWRDFPNYQLERRADIFFAIYLRAVLEEFVVPTRDVFIPEFPVKHGETNRSDKVDYLARSEDGRVLMLVELKTAALGHRIKQIQYLRRAATALREPAGVKREIEAIVGASRSIKYVNLVAALRKMELWGAETATAPESCLIVFIQPTQDLDDDIQGALQGAPPAQYRIIDFEMFAQVVERQTDALSKRFAESLRRWSKAADDEIRKKKRIRSSTDS